MIKTEKGRTELKGKENELFADLAVIVSGLNETLSEVHTKEEIENFIHEAVANGLKDKEELAEENKEEIRVLLTDIMETILNHLKGTGEE